MPENTSKTFPFNTKTFESLFSSITAKLALTATFIFICALHAAAQSGVKTDLGVYPVSAAPVFSGAGSKITDPTFGTQIMRVTDQNDGQGFGTAYSYWSTFNVNSTRLLVQSEAGTPMICDFDPAQFKLLGKQPMIYPPGSGYTTTEDAIWSALDPDTLFIHRGAAIYAYNARSRSYTASWDLSSQFPAGAYLLQMSVSRNDDVFAFTIKNADYSVGGYAVWQRSTNRILYSERTSQLDEVQIDKTGRFLVVKTGQSGAGVIEVKIVDLQTSTVTNLTDNQPDFSPGHSDNGRGFVVGADNWTNRLTARNLATPHDFKTVLSFGNNWAVDFHVSLLGDNEDWALISFYGQMNAAFDSELILAATDGSQRVMRFAHHYSVFKTYNDTPRANISRDGRYVAFTSNWGGTNRRDLYIAQVPATNQTPVVTATPTPAPPPPPPSATPTPQTTNPQPTPPQPTSGASFESVSGFGGNGGYLSKLATPYYASADAAGILNGDGWFSYKYNPVNNGKDVVVLLDDGRNNFAVINQGRYLEVRANGTYLTDFPLDVNKTIKLERAGGLLKVWQDAALRFSMPMGALSGAAKFKIKSAGEQNAVGIGINGATSALSASTVQPVITTVSNSVSTQSTNIFQNVVGYKLSSASTLEKLATPYYAAAETVATLNGDGWFSYKYNQVNNGRDIGVFLENGQHSLAIINQGRYLEIRLDGAYQTDFLLDLNQTVKIEKIGGVIKVWQDAALRYSAPVANLFTASKFRIKCGGEANTVGIGINSAVLASDGATF